MNLLKQMSKRKVFLTFGLLFCLVITACDQNNAEEKEKNHDNNAELKDEAEKNNPENDKDNGTNSEGHEENENESNDENLEAIDSSDYPDFINEDHRSYRGFDTLVHNIEKLDVKWKHQFKFWEETENHLTYEWLGEEDGIHTIHLMLDSSKNNFVFEADIEVDEEGTATVIDPNDDLNPDPEEFSDVDSYLDFEFSNPASMMTILFDGFNRFRDSILYAGDTSPLVDFETSTNSILDQEVETVIIKTGDESEGLSPYANAEVEAVLFDDLEILLSAVNYKEDKVITEVEWQEFKLKD